MGQVRKRCRSMRRARRDVDCLRRHAVVRVPGPVSIVDVAADERGAVVHEADHRVDAVAPVDAPRSDHVVRGEFGGGNLHGVKEVA